MRNLRMPEKNSKCNEKEQESRAQRLLKGRGCNIWSTLFWFLMAIGLLFWNSELGASGDVAMISYSEFRQQVQDNNVTSVTVQGESINGQFELPIEQTQEDQTTTINEFETVIPSFGDDGLLALLEAHDVTVETQPERNFTPAANARAYGNSALAKIHPYL